MTPGVHFVISGHLVVSGVLLILIGLPSLYLILATWRVAHFGLRKKVVAHDQLPVTVLKPVCGLEPGLYENLRSFCLQEYPEYQVIFGIRDRTDPAIPIIERIIDELPNHDLDFVIDSQTIGPNLKISNLHNIYRVAKHDILVIADSDIRVDQDYISTIVQEFGDRRVGLVTCLYTGTPQGGLTSRLAAMFINEWFLPSVLAVATNRGVRFCFGATMVVRREVLEKIGAFKALSSYLADDFVLGKLVRQAGYTVKLSSYVVENIVSEKNFKELFMHELRWARTVRSVEPIGHIFSFVMYGIPLAILAAVYNDLTIDSDSLEIFGIILVLLLRLGLRYSVYKSVGNLRKSPFWLLPIRDFLCFAVWGISFFSREIRWKENRFYVNRMGHMIGKGTRS